MSEYDPVPPRVPLSNEPSDLERVQARFARSADAYLRSPWSWWTWCLVLPAAALATRKVYPIAGGRVTLIMWAVFILCGGLVEGGLILGGRRTAAHTPLANWVLRAQGNLSLVAVALSVLLVWKGLPGFLPAVWLLLVGHSFYVIGKLSFGPLRTAGLVLQVGGVAALLPWVDGLLVFAACSFVGCLWIGFGVSRRLRRN